MMKKVLFLFLFLLCHIAIIAQTLAGNVSIKINETSTITLSTIYSRILQNNATGVSYRWYSNNQSIATVSYSSYKNCTVRGKASGSCKVYFHADFYIDGYYRTYDFYWDVTVSGIGGSTTIVNPTGASVNPGELTLDVGQEYQLGYSVTPTNATYHLEWSSNNNSIATVTAYTGKVKAVGPGVIYVQMWVIRNDGGCDIIKSCKVTVNKLKETITINDASVKTICIQNWDTDGDGELSEDEAASVTDIGTVFRDNTDIQSLDVLQYFTGLTSIGYEAFNGCRNLSSIIIPNSVTSIGTSAFINCSSLSSIVIPSSVVSIGDGIFQGCSALTSIDVDSNNTVFDSRDNCNSIIQTSDNKLIAGCRTTTIPNTVTTIAKYACQNSSLTSIIIPSSVETIQSCAFRRCYSLTSVKIPENVAAINDRAFAECTNLWSVYCYIEEPYAIASSVFDKIPNDATLYVLNGTKMKYESTEGWNNFANIVEIGAGNIGNDDVIEPMIRTLWHQRVPYNNMIPDGVKAGCGPIAVAQMLNYYKSPNHGYGHVTLYNDLDYTTTSIDYSKILNQYNTGNYSQMQADAVANLVWQVGAAMTVKYPNNGTENNRMVWGIQKYLHISQNCRFRLRKFYSTEQWIKMLDEELAAGRPVFYRGRAFKYNGDPNGYGHLFVVDGKNAEGLYHINFGHENIQENKFASLDAINQSSSIYPGDDGVYYNWGQGMATDLYPDENFDENTFNDYPVYLEEPLCLNDNKRLDRLTIATGGSFQLTMNLRVYNNDYIKAKDGTTGYWQYALGVYSGGLLKTVITPQEGNTFSSTSVTLTRYFVFPTTIGNGEYELRVVTRHGNEELWQSVWDIAPNVINAVVDNNNVVLTTMGNHTLETNLYLLSPITEIGDANNTYTGKLFSLSLKNPSDNNFENKIKFEIISGGTVRATYDQMTSVYSGCEVEYHFLIPNEVFDFTNNSDYIVKAYYYEHNQSKYIELTTDEPTIRGDVNGDGEVNGTDMVALVNVIMEKTVYDNADVNEDGNVNGTDMVALVNIIMTANNNNAREYLAARKTIENQEQSLVSIDGEIKQGVGNSKELTIMLHNPEMDITMVQMDVTLPEGLSLREDGVDMLGRTTWSSHQLYTGNVGNRTTRLLLASGRNALIQGTEGGIILLSLVADDEFDGGDVVLHNMLCTSPDLTEVRPADFIVHAINGATGVSEMEKAGNAEDKQWYNLSGQRLSVPRKGVYIVGGKKVVK